MMVLSLIRVTVQSLRTVRVKLKFDVQFKVVLTLVWGIVTVVVTVYTPKLLTAVAFIV